MIKKQLLPLEGVNYRNAFAYSLLSRLKLGRDSMLRYKIASEYIKPGDFVMDVCAGVGELVAFLPQDCRYLGIEASPEFVATLLHKGLNCKKIDLHESFNIGNTTADIIVMIISLYHFRNTTLECLLEAFKKFSKKVVIVEDVLIKKRAKASLRQRAINYLCSTDYYLPVELFTAAEFEQVMQRHSYSFQKYNERYWVGCYGV
ncbi:MAG: class I SAM-dependent methyltransferase [Candidatus Omnitrophota bacterium]